MRHMRQPMLEATSRLQKKAAILIQRIQPLGTCTVIGLSWEMLDASERNRFVGESTGVLCSTKVSSLSEYTFKPLPELSKNSHSVPRNLVYRNTRANLRYRMRND